MLSQLKCYAQEEKACVLEHLSPSEGILERTKRIGGRIWLKNLTSLETEAKHLIFWTLGFIQSWKKKNTKKQLWGNSLLPYPKQPMQIKPKKLRASQGIHTALQKLLLQGLVAFFPSFTKGTTIWEKFFCKCNHAVNLHLSSFAQGLCLLTTNTELRQPFSHDPLWSVLTSSERRSRNSCQDDLLYGP